MDDKHAKKLRKNDLLDCYYNFRSNKRLVRLLRKFPKTGQALVQDTAEDFFDVVSFASLERHPIVVSVWIAGWKKKKSKLAQLVWSYERKEVDAWINKANAAKNIEWVTPVYEHLLPPRFE